MSIEIKVYLTGEQIDEDLSFHAVVYSQTDYDLLYDLDDTYEPLLVEALNGTLETEYFENGNYEKKLFKIEEDEYIESINKFSEFLTNFYSLNVLIEDTFETHIHVGVRLVGAGFRGKPENPMLEHSQYIARNSMHGIKTALFPSNNPDYINDDIYIKTAPGSLVLTLEATKIYNEPIAFMKKVYEDIETSSINPFQYEDLNQRARYQTIVERLSSLNNQKRLKEFYIIIDGEEFKITNRKYLKEKSKKIYNEDISLIGIYQGYKKGSDSFGLYIEGSGNFSCHLSKLSQDNYTQYSKVLNTLKNIDIFDSSVILKVAGEKIKPRTINVIDIEIK